MGEAIELSVKKQLSFLSWTGRTCVWRDVDVCSKQIFSVDTLYMFATKSGVNRKAELQWLGSAGILGVWVQWCGKVQMFLSRSSENHEIWFHLNFLSLPHQTYFWLLNATCSFPPLPCPDVLKTEIECSLYRSGFQYIKNVATRMV